MEVPCVVHTEKQEYRILIIGLNVEVVELLVDLCSGAPDIVLYGFEQVLLVEGLQGEELGIFPLAGEVFLIGVLKLWELLQDISFQVLLAAELHLCPRHLVVKLL